MKRFQVFSGEKLIGHSDLEGQDPSMGVALGRFLPSDGYPEVAPVFRTWVRATAPQFEGRPHDEELLAAYCRQRDALSLSVRTPSGEVVGTEWIHITDYSDDLGDDGYELSICLNRAPSSSDCSQTRTHSEDPLSASKRSHGQSS